MVTAVAAGPSSGDTWVMTGGARGVGGVGAGGFEPIWGEAELPVLPQLLSTTVTSRMAAAIVKSVFRAGAVKGFIVFGLMGQN
jgi:hypothetical protein